MRQVAARVKHPCFGVRVASVHKINRLHLENQYAAFGKVVAGMDVVDKIASVPTDWNDKPKTPVKMKTVELIEG